jgi:hypothetical protein
VFDNTSKILFEKEEELDYSGMESQQKNVMQIKVVNPEKFKKSKRKSCMGDSDSSSRVSSGTRAATKRLRASQQDAQTLSVKSKENNGEEPTLTRREATTKRQAEFVKELNAMNAVSYSEIAKRAHQGVIVDAQGNQFDERTHKEKTYLKNLESKSFNFIKPLMCLTTDSPHEKNKCN